MSKLYTCSTCCMLLSVWAFLQLLVMGVLYQFEVVTLMEDTEDHHAEDLKQFILHTTHNYKTASHSCLIVAGLYALTCVICLFIRRAVGKKLKKVELDDDVVCAKFDDDD